MIYSIHIYRFFEIANTKVTLDSSSSLTSIIGNTCSGKSVFIQALMFLKSPTTFPNSYKDAVVAVEVKDYHFVRRWNTRIVIKKSDSSSKETSFKEFKKYLNTYLNILTAECTLSYYEKHALHAGFGKFVTDQIDKELAGILFNNDWYVDQQNPEYEKKLIYESKYKMEELQAEQEKVQAVIDERTLDVMKLKKTCKRLQVHSGPDSFKSKLAEMEENLYLRRVNLYNFCIERYQTAMELKAAESLLEKCKEDHGEYNDGYIKLKRKLLKENDKINEQFDRVNKELLGNSPIKLDFESESVNEFYSRMMDIVRDGRSDATAKKMFNVLFNRQKQRLNKIKTWFNTRMAITKETEDRNLKKAKDLELGYQSARCGSTGFFVEDILRGIYNDFSTRPYARSALYAYFTSVSTVFQGSLEMEVTCHSDWSPFVTHLCIYLKHYILFVEDLDSMIKCNKILQAKQKDVENIMRLYGETRPVSLISLSDAKVYKEPELPNSILQKYPGATWMSDHITAKNARLTPGIRFAFRKFLFVREMSDSRDLELLQNQGITVIQQNEELKCDIDSRFNFDVHYVDEPTCGDRISYGKYKAAMANACEKGPMPMTKFLLSQMKYMFEAQLRRSYLKSLDSVLAELDRLETSLKKDYPQIFCVEHEEFTDEDLTNEESEEIDSYGFCFYYKKRDYKSYTRNFYRKFRHFEAKIQRIEHNQKRMLMEYWQSKMKRSFVARTGTRRQSVEHDYMSKATTLWQLIRSKLPEDHEFADLVQLTTSQEQKIGAMVGKKDISLESLEEGIKALEKNFANCKRLSGGSLQEQKNALHKASRELKEAQVQSFYLDRDIADLNVRTRCIRSAQRARLDRISTIFMPVFEDVYRALNAGIVHQLPPPDSDEVGTDETNEDRENLGQARNQARQDADSRLDQQELRQQMGEDDQEIEDVQRQSEEREQQSDAGNSDTNNTRNEHLVRFEYDIINEDDYELDFKIRMSPSEYYPPRDIENLSTGERVVVLLALQLSIGLFCKNSVLLIDEMESALDIYVKKAVRGVIMEIQKLHDYDNHVFLVTSDTDTMEKSDQAILAFNEMRSIHLRQCTYGAVKNTQKSHDDVPDHEFLRRRWGNTHTALNQESPPEFYNSQNLCPRPEFYEPSPISTPSSSDSEEIPERPREVLPSDVGIPQQETN